MAELNISEILKKYEAEKPEVQCLFDGCWEDFLWALAENRAAAWMNSDYDEIEHFFYARIRALERESSWLRKENELLRSCLQNDLGSLKRAGDPRRIPS